MGFQTTEAYSNLDLTKAKYSIYKHSREEPQSRYGHDGREKQSLALAGNQTP
jgi:hypothetical protein